MMWDVCAHIASSAFIDVRAQFHAHARWKVSARTCARRCRKGFLPALISVAQVQDASNKKPPETQATPNSARIFVDRLAVCGQQVWVR